jgi:hypothetical protein
MNVSRKTVVFASFAFVIVAAGAVAAASRSSSASPAAACDCLTVSKTIDLGTGVLADAWCSLDGVECAGGSGGTPGSRAVSFSLVYSYKKTMLCSRHFDGRIALDDAKPWTSQGPNIDLELARTFAADVLGIAYSYDSPEVVVPQSVVVRPRSGLTWGQVIAEDDLEVEVQG